jgi:hypothetical protein
MKHLALLLLVALTGCGGGGSSAVPTTQVATVPSATATPTSAPGVTPTATPIAPAGNHVVGAPAQVFTASGVRKPQSVSLGSGGVPTVVVGFSSTMGGTFSQLFTWAANASNQPVKETSISATPIGPLTLQPSVADTSSSFSATTFDWIITPLQLTGTGKINIAVTFGDGTTGTVPYFSYDNSQLACSSPGPTQWAYQGGVPVGGVSPPDVTIDCVHNTLVFNNGATLVSGPVADAYGNLASNLTTIMSGTWTEAVTTVPLSQVAVGSIYLAKTSDGGFMKYMVYSNLFISSSGRDQVLQAFSLHGAGNSLTFSF